MKRLVILAKSTAIAGTAAMLAVPAHAMTCEDFSGMSREAQQAAIMGIEAGRAEAREMARGDSGADDTGDQVAVTADKGRDSGREALRDNATGTPEVYNQVVETCEATPDMAVTAAMPPAASSRG